MCTPCLPSERRFSRGIVEEVRRGSAVLPVGSALGWSGERSLKKSVSNALIHLKIGYPRTRASNLLLRLFVNLPTTTAAQQQVPKLSGWKKTERERERETERVSPIGSRPKVANWKPTRRFPSTELYSGPEWHPKFGFRTAWRGSKVRADSFRLLLMII